jgi:hypothetical protein
VLQKWVSLFGFGVLSVMVLLLYGFTLYHAWLVKRPGTLVLFLLCVGLVQGIVAEGRRLWLGDEKDDLFSVQSVKVFSAVFLGAVIAFLLKVDLGLGAVVGAGLTALMAALVIPVLGVPVYCGAAHGSLHRYDLYPQHAARRWGRRQIGHHLFRSRPIGQHLACRDTEMVKTRPVSVRLTTWQGCVARFGWREVRADVNLTRFRQTE